MAGGGALVGDGELCYLPSDSGTCDAYLTSYYYDRVSRRCEQFVWTGCGGNANRFTSLGDCEQRCIYLETGATTTATQRPTTALPAGNDQSSLLRFVMPSP